MRQAARVIPPVILPSNVMPAWVLIFWRLYRGEAGGDYARAWSLLPSQLPAGHRRPDPHIAAQVLINHGLIG
ncbi:hypothetical protein SAMN05421890_1271 [Ensifer adhaerens]|nr:hypothetical protein SAMN05421890_1271 [Ensifer adhaerens]